MLSFLLLWQGMPDQGMEGAPEDLQEDAQRSLLDLLQRRSRTVQWLQGCQILLQTAPKIRLGMPQDALQEVGAGEEE